MEIKWYLKEEEFEKYKRHQKEYEHDGEYIGSVRTGNLCFDILNWGNHLWFELYVGGVDTGYGYSNRNGFTNYPYDYCDCGTFVWKENLENVSIEEFEKDLSEYIEEHINSIEGYLAGAEAVSLIDKANEELKLW